VSPTEDCNIATHKLGSNAQTYGALGERTLGFEAGRLTPDCKVRRFSCRSSLTFIFAIDRYPVRQRRFSKFAGVRILGSPARQSAVRAGPRGGALIVSSVKKQVMTPRTSKRAAVNTCSKISGDPAACDPYDELLGNVVSEEVHNQRR
jgi:hypothetical protein